MTDVNNLQQDHELGWDDEIEKESEFIILPAGDYNFTVGKVERGRFNGSDDRSGDRDRHLDGQRSHRTHYRNEQRYPSLSER